MIINITSQFINVYDMNVDQTGSKFFVGPICGSYRTGRSVVKVRKRSVKGPSFNPSRKVITELPRPLEARV